MNVEKNENGLSTLRIASDGMLPLGAQLGLQPGDVLVAINGKAFSGDQISLLERFKLSGSRSLALTFLRNDVDFTILAHTPNLCEWTQVPTPVDWQEKRQDPATLKNWEVFRNRLGHYDLHPIKPNILLLLCPPLWLVQYRLWVHAAVVIAVFVLFAAIWIILVPLVWIMLVIILKRTGTTLIRADRISRGLRLYAVIAAPSEGAAHVAYLKLEPGGQFIFNMSKRVITPKINQP